MGRLKQLFSYLWDIPIERSASKENPYLEVVWSNGRKMLNSKNANYSFGNGYKVFEFAFKHIPFPQQHVLVLGFGAGSVAHLLDRLAYKSHLTGVEYDAEIIRLYRDHFAKPNPPVDLHCMDALDYLLNDTKTYDLIVIDLFNDLDTSPLIYQQDFTAALLKRLSQNGSLIYNTVKAEGHDPNQDLLLQLSAHFKEVRLHHFQEINRIIIAK